MSIVALAPVMNGRVANRTKRRLVGIQHELMIAEDMLQIIEVLRESLFVHERSHQ